MNNDRLALEKALESILMRSSSLNHGVVDLVKSGGGRPLVAALIEAEKDMGNDRSIEDVLDAVLCHLEAYSQNDELGCCLLMCYLREFTMDTTAHDVYDAIGLWLVSSKADGLNEFLRGMASDEMASGSGETYFSDLLELRGLGVAE